MMIVNTRATLQIQVKIIVGYEAIMLFREEVFTHSHEKPSQCSPENIWAF